MGVRINSESCAKCGKSVENSYCKECDASTVNNTATIFIGIMIGLIALIMAYIFIVII